LLKLFSKTIEIKDLHWIFPWNNNSKGKFLIHDLVKKISGEKTETTTLPFPLISEYKNKKR